MARERNWSVVERDIQAGEKTDWSERGQRLRKQKTRGGYRQEKKKVIREEFGDRRGGEKTERRLRGKVEEAELEGGGVGG